MHAAGDAAEQLVGDGAGVGRNGLDRQALAPEGHGRADLRLRMAREVDRQHVHGHPAGERGLPAVEQHRRAGAGMARVAVAIADGGDADPAVGGGLPGAGIADRLPGRHLLDRDQAGGEGHDRPQPFVLAGASGQRRDAVEHDAGADPFGMGFRPGEHAGRIAEAALQIETLGGRGEAVDLRLGHGLGRLVGAGEMSHQAHSRCQRRAGPQPAQDRQLPPPGGSPAGSCRCPP